MSDKFLQVSGSPHVHSQESVKKIMWSVVVALLPAFLVSVYYFGIPVIVLTLVSVGCCILFEWLIQHFMFKGKSTVGDGSAVITGLLVAFNVPANLPIWILILGDLVAIGIAKMAFGGLGKNLFNPAITARVFLLISFPVQMTTWPVPRTLAGVADAVTGPTPLGVIKEGVKNGGVVDSLMNSPVPLSNNTLMEHMPNNVDMLLGQMGGSFGEVSAIAILIGALYLLFKKVITWHIPVSFMLTAFVFAGIFWLVDPTQYANPFFHLVTGGMMLGACFMATDMVTSPTSPRGMLVFGAGCGLITMIIRLWGAYPEGVSFSILIMNALVPLIDKAFKPKTFAK
ncbi:MAG: RnfABCDGE type electron transport complex subunit D [Bacteroidales bacterium]|nr:RnfABCDGE type electron transport complex subunit D [Bacteroidales bacterium]